MSYTSISRRTLLLLASLPLFLVSPVTAQDAQDEDEASQIIVTGSLIRQGGAQDVQHFRSIALVDLQNQGLPNASSLTVEGLLGEHDLALPSTKQCAQLFCIATHIMPAQLAGQSGDTQFLGIGFESGIDADIYRAEPLSLIAVVDRSGSMSGDPIKRAKEGLHTIVDQMREGDRLGIVLYGSTTLVHQAAIDTKDNRRALHRAIDAIEIDGSTYMEAGLKLGFATAFEELPQSRGKTRLMLFTDENPNVGDTTADGFMGQALDGSRRGVGMTTIGVGRHFDAELATKISSVRGGNLFFVSEDASAKELFSSDFENMVSEVAQDLVISIDPAEGYSISGIYGVPGEMITTGGSGTMTVTIGSAFLSNEGGGIYATLQGDPALQGNATLQTDANRASAPLAEISVSYTDAITQRRESDSDIAYASSKRPHKNLAKAHMLVDQYLTMTTALSTYHQDHNADAAADMLASLSQRMSGAELDGVDEEIKLVNNLRDNALRLAGHGNGRTLAWEVLGDWRVLRRSRVADLSRGDLVEINEHGEFITERMSGHDKGESIYQDFAINARQLHIKGSGLVLDYRLRGDRLTLRNRQDGVEIVLEREAG